tara:strand:- start:3168 stop:3470 length:303 start_codon:yes stop_codon:yes gene_type:complete
MALTITTPFITADGFEVANAYGRVAVVDAFTGTMLEEYASIYVTEAAYLAGANALQVAFTTKLTSEYDRNLESTDILDLAHDHLITAMAAEGITATKNLS